MNNYAYSTEKIFLRELLENLEESFIVIMNGQKTNDYMDITK